MKKDISELINIFINDVIFLNQYMQTENLKKKEYDPKLTVKLGKKIEKNAISIIKNGGINQFINLLDNKNLVIASTAAEYLYPLYPKRCISILRNYVDSLLDPLEKMKENDLITGLSEDMPFFTNHFKIIYGENYKELSKSK